MQRHRRAREELDTWTKLDTDAEAVVGLLELLDPDDSSIIEEIASEIASLETQLATLELQLMLGGEYDEHNAFLTIQSGAGGTESQDWAEMLLRMYSRWTDKRDFQSEVVEVSPGEEAGIKNATLRVSGQYAYGNLKSERGVHRLVRQSPFDAANRRHTSFARVDVVPVLEENDEISVSPEDIRTETFRASGAGGQHVNKTDSAVRITHLPSNIVVSCQNQKSQHQNREVAMQVLKARLLEKQIAEREAKQARLRGETAAVDFGSQIRSYVLHPYRMIKDVRTGVEVGDTDSVLDGNIDAFIEAWLRASIKSTDESTS
jgi:peptide chain release factor 2